MEFSAQIVSEHGLLKSNSKDEASSIVSGVDVQPENVENASVSKLYYEKSDAGSSHEPCRNSLDKASPLRNLNHVREVPDGSSFPHYNKNDKPLSNPNSGSTFVNSKNLPGDKVPVPVSGVWPSGVAAPQTTSGKCDLNTSYTDEQKIRDGRNYLGRSEATTEGTDSAMQKLEGLHREYAAKVQQLSIKETENSEMKTEMAECRERELRLKRECERLRAHLLATEDRYTREAVEAEEREEQLKKSLAALKEEMISSNTDVLNTKSSAAKQVDNLRSQLNSVIEQRNDALQKLAASEETISSYSSSLANLQMVLEQFQDETQSRQSVELEKCQKELDKERANSCRLHEKIKELETKADELSSSAATVKQLKWQITDKEAEVIHLHCKIQEQERELSETKANLQRFSVVSEDKIDRALVKNLLLGFIHTPASKREEAFRVVGHIVGFTDEELKLIGVGNSGNWISGLTLRAPTSPSGVGKSLTAEAADRSFFELFVQFLEKESSPPPQLKLPAERMAQEHQDKHNKSILSTPGNDFVLAALPLHPHTVPSSATAAVSQSPSALHSIPNSAFWEHPPNCLENVQNCDIKSPETQDSLLFNRSDEQHNDTEIPSTFSVSVSSDKTFSYQ